jgi:two-component system, cell cycle response regulator DivK
VRQRRAPQRKPPLSWQRKHGERTPGEASGTRRRAPVALLVDDVFDSRDMYGEILRFGGYRVVEAVDGAEALVVALGQQPDVIVMDLCMPRMNGWEAVQRLKADPRTCAIPVVVLTALGWGSGSVEVECEAYLVKPCLPLDLLGVVDALLASAVEAESV